MYQSHLHIHFAGRPCGVFDAVRGLPPPEGAQHAFSAAQALEAGPAEGADLILANVQGTSTGAAARALAGLSGTDAQIIALCDKKQAPALADGPAELEDLWVQPMSDAEVRFRFQRWQKARRAREDGRYLESALTEANRANEAKSKFLANMSREIRAPLADICGMAELLLDEELGPEAREYALAVKTSGAGLLRTVSDILDFSRMESGKADVAPAAYDFAAMIHDVMDSMELQVADRPVRLVTEVQDDVPRKLYGDVRRIKQILLNIMGNAARFTREGAIMLRVTWAPAGEGTIRLAVGIIDTGTGVKQEDLEKLFDPLGQMEAQKEPGAAGTGLGLAIAKLLVGRMGGTIEVESEFGKGSIFTFTILQQVVDPAPCEYSKGLREDWPGPFAVRFQAPEARVMVVDDSRVNLRVAQRLLQKFGIVPELVGSGMDCVSRLWTRTDYDLIFMDHRMPEMDGMEAARLIRSMDGGREIPIVALSASVTEGAERQYLDAGMNGFLAKPIDLRALGDVLERWLPPEKLVRPEVL